MSESINRIMLVDTARDGSALFDAIPELYQDLMAICDRINKLSSNTKIYISTRDFDFDNQRGLALKIMRQTQDD